MATDECIAQVPRLPTNRNKVHDRFIAYLAELVRQPVCADKA